MPAAPARNGRPAARIPILNGARDLTATASTTSSVLVCSDATGHRPAPGPAWARPTNRMPNATPATRPSTRAVLSTPRAAVPLAATSAIAGRATRTPTMVSGPGRSPRATPTRTGSTAAPTAETGPTTL